MRMRRSHHNVLVLMLLGMLASCNPKPPDDEITVYEAAKVFIRQGANFASATFSGERAYVLYPDPSTATCDSTYVRTVTFAKQNNTAWGRLDVKLVYGLNAGEQLSMTLSHVVGGQVSESWDITLANAGGAAPVNDFSFVFGSKASSPSFQWTNHDPIGGVWMLTPVPNNSIGATLRLYADAKVAKIQVACSWTP